MAEMAGEAASSRQEGPSPSLHMVRKLWRVAIIFFVGDRKLKARFLLALVLILCAVCAGLFVVMSYVQRDFATALSGKDVTGFHKAIWRFVGIVIIAAPLYAFYQYMQELLVIEWRVWLTELLLSNYFSNSAYFELKMEGRLDNPDQRICEDVASFTRNTVDIIALFASKFLNILGFIGVLWSIAPELVYFLGLYSAIGTLVTVYGFGKHLMTLKFQALQKEANFRYSLVRVRDNVESIAFYQGERYEASTVKVFLAVLVANMRELIVWNRNLSLFSNAYEFSMIIVPSIIIAPRYFSGEVEFGVISQTGFAFHKILSALSVIVLKFDNLSGLAAQTERLESLLEALQEHTGDVRLMKKKSWSSTSSSAETIIREEGPGLLIRDLTILTPNSGHVLFQNLNLQLAAGDSLLVMGPSGCGKSSLLRAIAGLWRRGSGLIQGPLHSDSFFLPQKPYMPLGSLREQLHFPAPKNALQSYNLNDGKLMEALGEVSLEDLLERVGNLSAVHDWSNFLSSGEQQRIAFARLFLHVPKVAFLDEASSALDARNEARLYSILHAKIESYVSVGHRTSLVKYHTHVLEFKDDSSWQLFTRDEFENSKPRL
ncbi:hypothetical protein CY35_01G165400 [Sphagnum magellanicum]|nr:hypothetical protein CY35_01G165400 [Sphagnum magellanicum]